MEQLRLVDKSERFHCLSTTYAHPKALEMRILGTRTILYPPAKKLWEGKTGGTAGARRADRPALGTRPVIKPEGAGKVVHPGGQPSGSPPEARACLGAGAAHGANGSQPGATDPAHLPMTERESAKARREEHRTRHKGGAESELRTEPLSAVGRTCPVFLLGAFLIGQPRAPTLNNNPAVEGPSHGWRGSVHGWSCWTGSAQGWARRCGAWKRH